MYRLVKCIETFSAVSPVNIPIFTLQGNFDVAKLHGPYRLKMEIMVKTAGKGLANKPDRTPEEDDMLDMMLHSGNRVSIDNFVVLPYRRFPALSLLPGARPAQLEKCFDVGKRLMSSPVSAKMVSALNAYAFCGKFFIFPV